MKSSQCSQRLPCFTTASASHTSFCKNTNDDTNTECYITQDLAARYRMGGARLVLKSGNFIEQQGGGSTITDEQETDDEDIPSIVSRSIN